MPPPTEDPSPPTPSSTQDSLESDDATLRKSLETYRNSVPYATETLEEMTAKLEFVVGRLLVCASAKSWDQMMGWSSVLESWTEMKYPMSRPVRAKLARFYYELIILPGTEPALIRSHADMLRRLIRTKRGSKPKLTLEDLELPWEPLWTVMKKEVFPNSRSSDSRNLVNIFLHVVETSRRFYPPPAIPSILSTFLPLLDQDNVLTVVTLLTSFLPLTNASSYIPALFKIWEAFNSTYIDDRMVELLALLAEEHVAGKGEDGYGLPFNDVGIFEEAQWVRIMRACLGSMNVPVGSTKNAFSTGQHADLQHPSRFQKTVNRHDSLAVILVYSIAPDSPVRKEGEPSGEGRYLSGLRSLESLERLITAIESFFHPSNSGVWTPLLTGFLQRLMYEFSKRWKEEEQSSCLTPQARRLTLPIRRAFINTLKTPALLAMFSKDPIATSYAQGALKSMSVIEPGLVMPAILERAYGGLEVVNETHRTTAVMSCLAGVAPTLASAKIWLPGQKHIVPLLELCIPGIDLNDPTKTVCTTMFVVAALQHIKIGDVMRHPAVPLSSDAPAEDVNMTNGDTSMPDGIDAGEERQPSREEEDALIRESTAGFTDWVTSFFRRIFALFENLPEEGGKQNKTGGKTEETVLKSIKSALDVVATHLSDELFDLVLKITYEYAISNARANSVRAFANLVSSLARVQPKKVLDKFFPYCSEQIKIELEHGASSTRTTTTHVPVPSDTTLHWNMAILRGILGYCGSELLPYKQQVLDLIILLVEHTKSERGYGGTGRLVSRVIGSLCGIYALNSHFVNTDEWNSEEFNRVHHRSWGRLYQASDVKVEWHVPSDAETAFVLEILDKVVQPSLDTLNKLLEVAPKDRDNIWRNDFCRRLHLVRSSWSSLSTFYLEQPKTVVNSHLDACEIEELTARSLDVKAGFTLTDPSDPRYQSVVAHRARFADFLHRASVSLQQSGGEDHIDAVMSVTKGIDVYLLEYGMSRGSYQALKKNHNTVKDLSRMWATQKEFPRPLWVERAQLYHSSRVHMHALLRRRSATDDQLLEDLVEFSLSPYTRVRKNSQEILLNTAQYLVRTSRVLLSNVYAGLQKEAQRGRDADPDRQKGALHLLWNKQMARYAISNPRYSQQYFVSVFDCQQQEKPSIQNLVSSIIHDSRGFTAEEQSQTLTLTSKSPRLEEAIKECQEVFSESVVPQGLLRKVRANIDQNAEWRNNGFDLTVSSLLEIALRPNTHWKYRQWAVSLLCSLIRRDRPVSLDIMKLFVQNVISDHPTTRWWSVRGISKLLYVLKLRTYSKTPDELWLQRGRNPLARDIPVTDPKSFTKSLDKPMKFGSPDVVLVDQIGTGFLVWAKTVKGYAVPPEEQSAFSWDPSSQPALKALCDSLDHAWFSKLLELWSQEGNRASSNTDLRSENVTFIKVLFKTFEGDFLDLVLGLIEPLWNDQDKYKQRAAAEVLAGLLQGSKHFPGLAYKKLWDWVTPRLPAIFAQINPDTQKLWESLLHVVLVGRDPRRIQPLVDFIVNMNVDYNSSSAFVVSKCLSVIGTLQNALDVRFEYKSDEFLKTYFDNVQTEYAEVRSHVAHNIVSLMNIQWQPSYPSVESFLATCAAPENDSMKIRAEPYKEFFSRFVDELPKWREERLPGARAAQSTYDKVGLTLLQIFWMISYSAEAALVLPYIMPLLPEILRMSELQDSSDLQVYSAAVLFVLSAFNPPSEFVEPIADHFVLAVKSSPSWRIRLNALSPLSVFFFRNLPSLSESCISRIMDVLLDCLQDENIEVRETTATTLSGILRCSQRQNVIVLKARFARTAQRTKLPPRSNEKYPSSLRTLHAAILGLIAALEAFPYVVEDWMPPLIEVLARHSTDPPPISTSIRKSAATFKKTHQDTWHENQQKFTEDQIQALSTMLSGTSYYA